MAEYKTPAEMAETTGHQVFVTIASEKQIREDYPFAVIPYTDGKPGGEITCRDARSCLLFANGVIAGMVAATGPIYGARYVAANPIWDVRLDTPMRDGFPR